MNLTVVSALILSILTGVCSLVFTISFIILIVSVVIDNKKLLHRSRKISLYTFIIGVLLGIFSISIWSKVPDSLEQQRYEKEIQKNKESESHSEAAEHSKQESIGHAEDRFMQKTMPPKKAKILNKKIENLRQYVKENTAIDGKTLNEPAYETFKQHYKEIDNQIFNGFDSNGKPTYRKGYVGPYAKNNIKHIKEDLDILQSIIKFQASKYKA
ncbi:hypothetical protein [Ligilactobacillus equi]